MDATMFEIGDRVRLVKMDDPYRPDIPIGMEGTVIGVAPKPINSLTVDWDGNFRLNPCLDSDIVEKSGHIDPDGMELYRVFTEDGVKRIKYDGYSWYADSVRPQWRLAAIDSCIIEIGEHNYDRMTELAETCSQYIEDLSEPMIYTAVAKFYSEPTSELHVDEVTADTPDGFYRFNL